MNVTEVAFMFEITPNARAQAPPPGTDAGCNDDVRISWSRQNSRRGGGCLQRFVRPSFSVSRTDSNPLDSINNTETTNPPTPNPRRLTPEIKKTKNSKPCPSPPLVSSGASRQTKYPASRHTSEANNNFQYGRLKFMPVQSGLTTELSHAGPMT